MSVNAVNNFYKPDPATQPEVARCIARIDDNLAKYANFEPRWHIEGNVVAGGWPSLASVPPPPDGDGDGMPDAWEVRKGLDPHDPADRNGHDLDAESTNLEAYLNELAVTHSPAP